MIESTDLSRVALLAEFISQAYGERADTDWLLSPARDEVLRVYDGIWFLIGSRQIEELVDYRW